MPLSPPSISRTFSSSQTESLSPLNINSPSPLPLTPGNHSTFLSLWVYLVLGTSYKWDHTYLSFCVWLISLSISLGILDSSLEFGNPDVLATDFWSMWWNSSNIFSEVFALPALEMVSRSFSPKKPPYTLLIQLWITAVVRWWSWWWFHLLNCGTQLCWSTMKAPYVMYSWPERGFWESFIMWWNAWASLSWVIVTWSCEHMSHVETLLHFNGFNKILLQAPVFYYLFTDIKLLCQIALKSFWMLIPDFHNYLLGAQEYMVPRPPWVTPL